MVEVRCAILGQFLEFAFGCFLGDAFGGCEQESHGALLLPVLALAGTLM
jgi:hypothetical protein